MAVKPVVIALSRSGETVARQIAASFGVLLHGREGRVDEADAYFPNALDHIRDLFASGTPVVGVCASGILIRAVAPLLADKLHEPPLVSVSDDGMSVVPLLGGHRGANRLAREIAELMGARAAVTTAGDVALQVALDEPPPGWRLANPEDAKGAMAALLAGEGARISGEPCAWLSGLPSGEGIGISSGIAPAETGPNHLHFAPLRVTIGVGCARNCPAAELEALVMRELSDKNISPAAVHSINTLDLKADEPAVLALAKKLGVPLRVFGAEELNVVADKVLNPSKIVFLEVRTRSVSEAAALAQSPGSELISEKKKSQNATCAVALSPHPIVEFRGRARGRLAIVGIGPGQGSWRTPEASRLIAEAEELVGYGLYIDLLGPLAAGKPRFDFPLGGEEARCRHALERAGEGYNVALICSGDAGIYAMGALVYELLNREDAGLSDAARRVEIVSAPGVSALQAAAARAGAPLGHDFCAISLSDLLTPRQDILRRIQAAADGDFVIAFYNPVSKRRRTLLAEAQNVLLAHRPADTPVILASSLGRPEEEVRYRRLDALEVDEVDMLTVVIVGSSSSQVVALGEGPRVYTPRGYERKSSDNYARNVKNTSESVSL